MLSTNVLRYGWNQPLPKQILLQAGPLSLLYEAGDLRSIRIGEREVLRRVYVAVRDRNWSTIPLVLSEECIEKCDDSFRISYTATHRQNEIDFAWQAVITGEADGTIRFAMDGEAHATFLRNRIGFCVLHPASAAGASCRVTHADGTTEQSRFPTLIAPQRVEEGRIHPVYPFAELRTLSHEVSPGTWAQVDFEGEIFELEDQRNWTDGSFKTYGTPLRLPFPAEIAAGTRIQQAVTLRVNSESGTIDAAHSTSINTTIPLSFSILPSIVRLPPIGLGIASHGKPLTTREIERLRVLNLAHLRVDLTLGDPMLEQRLQQATDEATALDVGLEAALFLSDAGQDELRHFQSLLAEVHPRISAWLIFHVNERSTSERWIRLARTYLADYAPNIPFVSGTNAYLTELNRERPPVDALDAITYSVNPQVHAFDNTSIVETSEVIATTVESARAFSDGQPIRISPITLRPRFNANATGPESAPQPGELPSQVDVRQMSLFGACWTVAVIKYIAESGTASATCYETTGWRGVMETENGSPLPEQFQSLPSSVFPLYHVLADISAFADGKVVALQSSNPLAVDGLMLRHQGMTRIMLANMTNVPQEVRVPLFNAHAHLRILDETNAVVAMRDPEAFRAANGEWVEASDGVLLLRLLPYGVARIDWEDTRG